jgi:cell division protein FtsQ
MKRTLAVIVAILFLGYFITVLFMTRDKQQDVICRDLIITIKDSADRHFIDEKKVVSLLKNAKLYPVNQPVNQINTHDIKKKLAENELIADATVYKTPSGNIKIELTQKMPVLRVFGAQGSYYIDEQGHTMPAHYQYAIRLPVASGNIEKSVAITDLYKFALFLQKHEFWNNQIEQIYIHPNKEVELIPRVGDHRIFLGDFNDYTEKMNNLQLFYEQAIPKLGWEKYDVINLKYKNQIVCTKK